MPSKIILIAAITADGYIAKDDKDDMAWSLDKALFKKQTSEIGRESCRERV